MSDRLTVPSDGLSALGQIFERDRALNITGIIMLALTMPTLTLAALDERTFNGVSTWLKLAKFELSLAIFMFTLAWFMGHVRPEARTRGFAKAIRWTVIVTAVFEVSYIGFRAARAEGSHFNVTDAFAALMFSLMGVAAVALTMSTVLLAILLWRKGTEEPNQVAIRGFVIGGLVITGVLGTITGFSLAGNNGALVGSVQTDAGGLSLLGWARDAGDLRVPHFFALHAMQIIPAIGAIFVLLAPRIRLAAVGLVCSAYLAFNIAIYMQALAGEPFLPGLTF